MKPARRFALLLSLLILTTPAFAADETTAAETPTGEPPSRIKLQLSLEADRQTLEKLQQEVARKTAESGRLGREIERYREAIERLQKRIDTAKRANRPVAALEQELADLQLKQKTTRLSAETLLQETESIKDRIASLEKQIAAAESILGSPEEELPPAPEAEKPPATSEETGAPAIPGMPPMPAKTAPPTGADKQAVQLRPEQIEAAKVAREKSLAARKAEQDVVRFVERRTALKAQIAAIEEQIATEQNTLHEMSLLETELKKRLTEARRKGDSRAVADLQAELKKIDQTIARVQKSHLRSQETLRKLKASLARLDQEEEQYVAAAERRRAEAEAARRESVWLQSPLHPRNVLAWLEERGPRLLMVVALIVLLLFLSRLSITTMVRYWTRRLREEKKSFGRVNRLETLGAGYDAVMRFIILVGGTFMLLEEAGIDLNALLGGAAIIGVALAFGAQNLIRDYFNGFMILLEDQYELGDLVTIGPVTGTVERVNMRTTVLRDLEGKVHFIPNSNVNQVTNSTYKWANALFDIPIPLDRRVDPVLDLIREEAEALYRDPEWGRDILAEPEILGVDRFGPAAVYIKFLLRTRPDRKFPVRREMLRRLKNRFDNEGIPLPDQRCLVPATSAR